MMRPLRVAFLTNIVSPYRKPVFERLAQTPNWWFRVFACAANEHDRTWEVDLSGLEVVIPKTLSWRRRVKTEGPVRFEQDLTLHVPVGLWGALRRFAPDVIVAHELGPRTGLAALYAKRYGVPLVIWSYHSRLSASAKQSSRTLREALLRQAEVVVGMGTQAREVLRGWGVPEDAIVDAYNACDLPALERRQAEPEHGARVEALRARWGEGRKLALVVGRLVPLKGVARMLELWREVPAEARADWRLVFVGHGPLEAQVRAAAADGVVYGGNLPSEAVADAFSAADLHIFPTLGDVWGLVVQEAMGCGTPTLCSTLAGCVDDVVRPEVDGLCFDPSSSEAAGALQAALGRQDLADLGRRARERAGAFDLDGMAGAFRRAIERALAARCPI